MAEGFLNAPYNLKGKRIWVAGASGMVGAAICRALESESCEILTVPKAALDLRDQAATHGWIAENKPDVIILAAARVGGILANETFPAGFLYDNLMIEANVIQGATKARVEKLLFLGSSCIYPKEAENPISEDALLTGALEPTNEAYAIAKIAGVKLCQAYRSEFGCDFISAMPCNLYGPGDTFNTYESHVIPALMLKAHKAKIEKESSMTVWGSGEPRREFLHVDDLAGGLLHLLKNYSSEKPINIGAGQDCSIRELAEMVCAAVGYEGDLQFDNSKPDGTFRKLMDNSRITASGWSPSTSLCDGLKHAYEWFLQNEQSSKQRAA
jgi:GDP-L-fucose synthase